MDTLRLSTTLACVSLCACAGTVSSSASSSGGDPPRGDWTCIAEADGVGTLSTVQQESTPPAPGGDAFTVHLRDPYSHAGLGGLQVQVCSSSDEECTSPIDQESGDDLGVATVRVPGGLASFEGYLRITGAPAATNLVFFAGRRPPYGSGIVEVDVYAPRTLQKTAALAGVTLDPQRAVLRVDALDCAGAAARGVSLTVGAQDDAAVAAYFAGAGTALSRDASSTDPTGIAFAFGVAEGTVGVAARLDGIPAGGSIGFARAGAVTSLVVRP